MIGFVFALTRNGRTYLDLQLFIVSVVQVGTIDQVHNRCKQILLQWGILQLLSM